MAGKAELSGFGPVHVFLEAAPYRNHRQNKQRKERQDLALAAPGDSRAEPDQKREG
jgi:hypothetical protein